MGADGIGELLAARRRLATELSAWVHGVLRADRVGDVSDRHTELGQSVRFDPAAQRVLSAEDLHATDAGHAGQRIHHVDERVVREERRVVRALRRIQTDQHQRRGVRLLHRDAELQHVGGKARVRLRCPRLREDLVGVRIGADVEDDMQLHHAVVGVDGVHVAHVVDAAHLLLDRRRHGLLDRERVGADIVGLHHDLGRHDVRILRHRKLKDRHGAHDHHEQGDHHRHDRAVDEELRHDSIAGPARGTTRGNIWFRGDLHAGPHLLRPLDDHELIGLEAALDHAQRVDLWAKDNGLHGHGAVGLEHHHLKRALQLRDGTLRHEQRVVLNPRRGAHATELTRAQQASRVWKRRRDPQRSGQGVDLSVREQKSAGMRIL